MSGFLKLSQADQITLVQQGSFEVIFARYTSLFSEQGMFLPDMSARIPRYRSTSSSISCCCCCSSCSRTESNRIKCQGLHLTYSAVLEVRIRFM